MPNEVLFKERYGADKDDIVYVKPTGQNRIFRLGSVLQTGRTPFLSFSHKFRTVFLPQGYPNSVSSDYFQYQVWDTIQAFCSSITGALATRAILEGFGVGDPNATIAAATLIWISRDGAGMMSKILFAWWKGNELDADCKRWRFVADILNDIAICCELLAPLWKEGFLYVVSLATVMKSIVGVSGGATRAAITQHQARRGNMADVSAKDGSQETLVNFAALLVNLVVLPLVTEDQSTIWKLFIMFTMFHLAANYQAVRSLVMDSLNTNRLLLILERYLTSDTILSLQEANHLEPVLLRNRISDYDLCGFRILLGSSLRDAVHASTVTADELLLMTNVYKGHQYLLYLNRSRRKIHILLKASCEVEEILEAYFHAVVLGITTCRTNKIPLKVLEDLQPEVVSLNGGPLIQRLVRHSERYIFNKKDYADAVLFKERKIPLEAMLSASEIAPLEFQNFLARLQSKDWKTKHQLLKIDEWRADWNIGT